MPSLKYPNHLLFAKSILARMIDRVQLFVHSYNKQPSKPSRSLLLYNYRVIWCHQIGVSMGLMWNGGQYVFWTKKHIVWLFTHLVLARIGPFSPAPLKWQQMILSLDKDRPPLLLLPIYFLAVWAHFQNFQQLCRHEYNVRYPSIFGLRPWTWKLDSQVRKKLLENKYNSSWERARAKRDSWW